MQNADESVHSRVRETLEELALDPVPQGAKRIIESQEKNIPAQIQAFKAAL
ncbi:hypothetical protein [Methanosarcina horonobensis]|uniref:hypothetical protein n=1 Tax=Methanosarcina horonobensis TaxID=418008 RepID=UPI0022B90969|nr:hypothetical protein [Methanosarcina horonobensis]